MRPVRLVRGETLFTQEDEPDGCYSVFEGLLKISILDAEGNESVIAILGPGDVTGEMGLGDGTPRSATVIALEPSVLAFLATRDFNRIAEVHPVIYQRLLKIVSGRLRATNETVAVHQNLPLEGRLAHVLLRLAEGIGRPLEDGRLLICHKFTQADLGLMTGSARENVSRQLNQWSNEGILSKLDGHYCIVAPERLRAILIPTVGNIDLL
ncbi:MAG: Crp/Fnr family transcriptional regulator [Rhodospirillales bacterium]|nr:Crp/Fnr family transcriptional regulator [Rhodospirillales bacterium]